MQPNTKSQIYLKHYEIFFVIMCCNVFNVWPKTTLLFPVWPRDPKGWTPLYIFIGKIAATQQDRGFPFTMPFSSPNSGLSSEVSMWSQSAFLPVPLI